MKLSTKLFKIVVPASIILILFIYIFSKIFLLKNFTDIEIQEALVDNKVVINFIQRDLSNLSSMDVDYAKWDETYNYVINKNDGYIASNFDDTTSLQSAGVNFVLITNNEGDIFFSKNVQEKTKNIFTETLAKKIASDASKLLSNKNTKNVLGIDEYNKIPILISAEKITKSDGSGVNPGIFIFAKYYNKKEIDDINQNTQLKTELVAYDKNLILNNDPTNNDTFVKINNDKVITSYGLIKNIFSEPAFFAKVSLQRNIFNKAENAINFYILILMLVLLLFSLGAYLLIKEVILKKINTIKETVERVQSSQDLSSVITLKGNDEISELGTKFNNMLRRLKKSDETIFSLAYYDVLTGLPNRKNMLESSSILLEKENENLALFFIDLDNFKSINDNFGHEAGDLVLAEVAKRLKNNLTSKGIISRIAGDEFIVIIEDLKSISGLSQIAEKLVKALSDDFIYDENRLYIGASIGISLFPEHGKDVDALIKNADLAMYEVKNSGGHGYAFYNNVMNDNVINKLEMKKNLKKAMEENEFVTYYQPIIDLKSEKNLCAESLIRWKRQERIISPVEFIPVAKKLGEIVAIDNWMLESACKQCKKWHELGATNFTVSVNVSYKQLIQLNFVQFVMNILHKESLESKYLNLEITEDEAMEDINLIMEVLLELKSHGVKISLDDFGTGYSSLSYINKLPVDIIKIDRSLMINLKSNSKNTVIVKTIIVMAHSLNIKIVAEGIETEEELSMLKEFKCDYIQGYLIGKPMPAADFSDNFIKKIIY